MLINGSILLVVYKQGNEKKILLRKKKLNMKKMFFNCFWVGELMLSCLHFLSSPTVIYKEGIQGSSLYLGVFVFLFLYTISIYNRK